MVHSWQPCCAALNLPPNLSEPRMPGCEVGGTLAPSSRVAVRLTWGVHRAEPLASDWRVPRVGAVAVAITSSCCREWVVHTYIHSSPWATVPPGAPLCRVEMPGDGCVRARCGSGVVSWAGLGTMAGCLGNTEKRARKGCVATGCTCIRLWKHTLLLSAYLPRKDVIGPGIFQL